MANNYVNCINWIINGCGDPRKRGKVLTYLKYNKGDIAFIQETHFKGEEAAKMKRRRVSQFLLEQEEWS